MKNSSVAQQSSILRNLQTGIVIVLSMLFLPILLDGLPEITSGQVFAAPESGNQNITTHPATLDNTSLASVIGWDSARVIDPIVITDTGLYKMWYTGQGLDEKFRIGYATSPDGVNWTKYVGNPVLDLGAEGTWDSEVVRVNAVIKDGMTYRMWYAGNGHQRIGYATSPDGINWTKYAGNPVFDVGSSPSWDEGIVSFAGIISDAGLYKMWYSGGGASGFGGIVRIGYATSPDGIIWTRFIGNPVLDVGLTGWDAAWVFDPYVIKDGTSYKMWYSGIEVISLENSTFRIGFATSPDGIAWTKSSSNPVLDVNPGGWDSQTATAPWVIFDGSIYHMWYHGGVPGGINNHEMIGYATSSDSTSWVKYADNPVLTPTQLVFIPITNKGFAR